MKRKILLISEFSDVYFSWELDIALKNHFENNVVFKGTSKIIQNGLHVGKCTRLY